MHELSIMGNILDIVLESAAESNAKKVNKINLRIGIMSDILPQWAQTYFEMLSKETIADGAELVIEKVPVLLKCKECGHEFGFEKADDLVFVCPECESIDLELLTGRELSISSIEIDD